jgi:hypothetical protein
MLDCQRRWAPERSMSVAAVWRKGMAREPRRAARRLRPVMLIHSLAGYSRSIS